MDDRLLLTVAFGTHDGLEPTDRLIPPGWQGNPWGPEATKAREEGVIPPVAMSNWRMKEWDAWGKQALRDGDVLFRRGEAPSSSAGISRSAGSSPTVSGSQFSRTGIAAIEEGEPVVYDTTRRPARPPPAVLGLGARLTSGRSA